MLIIFPVQFSHLIIIVEKGFIGAQFWNSSSFIINILDEQIIGLDKYD